MATVKITETVITSITAQVRKVYEAGREKIDMTLPETIEGFANYLHELLVDRNSEKAMLAAMPEWYPRSMIQTFTVRMTNKGNSSWRNAPTIYVTLKEPMLQLPVGITRHGLPGIEAISWNGSLLSVVFDDVALIPSKYRDYVTKMIAIPAAHDKITKASKEAADTMARFLRQFKTVQAALKAENGGPALSHFFDYWLKNELERKPPPRVRKPKEKVDPETVDITKIIAKAAADKLSL